VPNVSTAEQPDKATRAALDQITTRGTVSDRARFLQERRFPNPISPNDPEFAAIAGTTLHVDQPNQQSKQRGRPRCGTNVRFDSKVAS
jgi:hypothetical protein